MEMSAAERDDQIFKTWGMNEMVVSVPARAPTKSTSLIFLLLSCQCPVFETFGTITRQSNDVPNHLIED